VSIMLFTSTIAFSLFLNQVLVGNLLTNDDVSLERKLIGFKYYGTFSRSLFSMFELTLANWTTIGRFFLEDVHESFGMAMILYKLTMGFTVVAVINGCFINETFKLAEQDDLLMVLKKDKERQVHAQKMLKLLEMADSKGDGTLTRQEFIEICKNQEVDKWLGAQGLRVTDAGAIFDLIDTGEGLIHKQELVAGARRLQGNARSLDVAKNHNNMLKNHEAIESITKVMISKFDDIGGNFRILHSKVDSAGNASRALQAVSASDGVPDTSALKQDLSRITGDMAEVRKLLSTYLVPMMRPPPSVTHAVQVTNIQASSKPEKVLWGCG